MAEPTPLTERSPWSGLWRDGRFGGSGAEEPGVVIRPSRLGAAALIAARKGRSADLVSAARAAGLDLPTSPRWVPSRDLVVLWAGPHQWLVRGPRTYAELELSLSALSGQATFIDQSHARAALAVAGPRARDALAKGFEIDLHPRAFRPGDVALTQVAGMSAHLWQLDEVPAYEIAVPSSFAGSFWHWLSAAAAEYGYLVEA